MFDLENILSYANTNIQIIGAFIAIIGGLVATKLLNAKIEKDTLKEKLNKLIREINFNTEQKARKEHEIYLKNRENYMYYIYDKIDEHNFDISKFEDYDLTEKQRLNIIEEVKNINFDAKKLLKGIYNRNDIEEILKNNHIHEDTIEYAIYYSVGIKIIKDKNKSNIHNDIVPKISDDVMMNPEVLSIPDDLNKQRLNNKIEELNELLKWKLNEKEDIESKIKAISEN